MALRTRAHVATLTLLALLGSGGCGVSTQHTERYLRDVGNPDSSFSKEVDRFRIQLLLQGTRHKTPESRDSVFFDSVAYVRAPHTLYVSTAYYGTTEDTAEIHGITMQVDEQAPIVLHGRDETPIELAFGPWLDHAVSASFQLPLGEKLPFVDGQQVTVEVTFVPPESTKTHSIRTVFRAEYRSRKTSKLEMLVKGA